MIFHKIKGSGEDIVLLHGGCDTHHSMQPIMDILSDRYRITNIDEPGQGQSPWQPQIKNIHDIADAILPVLPENAIYINWSFGGLIALSIASRYPERVSRIINIASVPRFIEDINWPGVAKPGFKVSLPMINEHGVTAFFRQFYDLEFQNIEPKPLVYNQLINILSDIKAEMNAINAIVNICDETDLRKEFSLLNCPIDIILGQKDHSVPAALHEKLQQLNPQACLHVINNAQHMIHWTHPTEFYNILEKILVK